MCGGYLFEYAWPTTDTDQRHRWEDSQARIGREPLMSAVLAAQSTILIALISIFVCGQKVYLYFEISRDRYILGHRKYQPKLRSYALENIVLSTGLFVCPHVFLGSFCSSRDVERLRPAAGKVRGGAEGDDRWSLGHPREGVPCNPATWSKDAPAPHSLALNASQRRIAS